MSQKRKRQRSVPTSPKSGVVGPRVDTEGKDLAVDRYLPPPDHPCRLGRGNGLWHAAKQIDELGGEWSYLVFIYRAMNLHLKEMPPTFFEPLSRFSTLTRELGLIGWAKHAGVRPPDAGAIGLSTKVYRSLFSAEDGVVPDPDEDESSIGNHSWAVIGRDETHLHFQSSWPTWPGGNGAGKISFEYLEKYTTEMWAARPVAVGPQVHNFMAFYAHPDRKDFRRRWLSPHPKGRQAIRFDPIVRFNWQECYSFDAPSIAEYCWLSLDSGTRVAGAPVRFDESTDGLTAVILDLFVWPNYRRIGYGSDLFRAIVARARKRGCTSVALLSYDADMVMGESRSRGFMTHHLLDIVKDADAQVGLTGNANLPDS